MFRRARVAAWAWALKQNNNDPAKAKEFVARLYNNVPLLDTGARGSTMTFAQRGIGDVLIAWENEAFLAQKEFKDGYEIVTPSLSILAEPTVTVVDKVVKRKGTAKIAEEYLKFLYTPEAQDIAGRHHYRPRLKEAADKYAATFAKVELVTIDEQFGGWQKAQKEHFGEGGTFDQIYKK